MADTLIAIDPPSRPAPAPGGPDGPPQVALVTMPCGSAKFPSIQLGTLSRALKNHGIGVKSYHFNLLFAHRIGPPLYDVLCETRGMLGEWLFSAMLFRDNPKRAEYPRVFKPVFEHAARAAGCGAGVLEDIARTIAPQFLTELAAAYDWTPYTIVGFTSTFDQNVASLTLAKLIKDAHPGIRIVFGGANFDGTMGLEYFRAFPWIDYVVVGEGDTVFPALAGNILQNREDRCPPGVAYRKDGRRHFQPNTTLFADFAGAGTPDYDDYFDMVRELEGRGSTGLNRILLYEGSRGCWWGEKHHCTFCGLNAQAMAFRAKSPAQVAGDMDVLSSRYDTTRFRLVDNIIDLRYIDALFGHFADQHYDFDVFMETKANLTKRQIHTLARGGVKCMQPGIESLSAAQLKEMDKGVSPLQNIQCLKWSRYYNVDITWNLLLGFPQETDEDYRRQIALIPALVHLPPPESAGKLWLERFSPYFMRPGDYDVRITGPGAAYEYIYDARTVDLNLIAYDFEYEVARKADPALYAQLTELVRTWRARYFSQDRPFLFYAKAMRYVTVYDGRATRPASERVDPPGSWILDYCNEAPKTLEHIRRAAAGRPAAAPGAPSIDAAVDALVAKRFMVEDRGRHFTIALPANPHL